MGFLFIFFYDVLHKTSCFRTLQQQELLKGHIKPILCEQILSLASPSDKIQLNQTGI